MKGAKHPERTGIRDNEDRNDGAEGYRRIDKIPDSLQNASPIRSGRAVKTYLGNDLKERSVSRLYRSRYENGTYYKENGKKDYKSSHGY
jgi:hypothetical protein